MGNLINIITADALAPYIKLSVPMILTIYNRDVFVIQEEEFELPVALLCGKMM